MAKPNVLALSATEIYVPAYSLEQSSRDGSKQFSIAQSGGLTQQQKDLFFVPHRKDFYMLVFVKQGGSRHWVDMVPYTIKPDTLYFTAPQQVHLKEEAVPMKGTSICFTEEFLGLEENRLLKQLPVIQNPYNGHELLLASVDVAFIEDIVAKLLEEYHHKLGWRNSMLLAYLRVLLIYISRLYTARFTHDDSPADRDLLKKFKTLITENFTQSHDVAGYASMLHLSAGHFSELIKEQSGKTAIEHIHDRLLLEAKRMLFHTNGSIKEIAYQLGFEDASYFNRFFKRLAGSTPLLYRKTVREMYH
jgi:AraC family transcriptional regulator, transcriptional activator of pobA